MTDPTPYFLLTHWGRVTHICVSKGIITDNGLLPGRRQAIIWTNAEILLIGPLRTNFSEISIEIHIFSFKKMYLKISSGNWQPSCPGLNVLTEPLTTQFLFYHNSRPIMIPFIHEYENSNYVCKTSMSQCIWRQFKMPVSLMAYHLVFCWFLSLLAGPCTEYYSLLLRK